MEAQLPAPPSEVFSATSPTFVRGLSLFDSVMLVGDAMIGSGSAGLMAAAIMVSITRTLNALSLAGAATYYSMAGDGLFFPSTAQLIGKAP